MGKQSRAKKSSETFGKGKVTPVQIAFIVDRYLSDNNFSETRSVFRNEASSLISISPVQEAPKSLLSLGAMLNEYVCLKEQKVMMDQERVRLDQEKFRVQTLLQGMQNVMNVYNSSGSQSVPSIPAGASKPIVVLPQSQPLNGSPLGYSMQNTPMIQPVSTPSNINTTPSSFLTANTSNPSTNKRKVPKVVLDAPPAAKKPCGKLPIRKWSNKETVPQLNKAGNGQESAQPSCAVESSPNNCLAIGSMVGGSAVAKCLFNQPSLPIPTNASYPKTPPRANSSSSQSNKTVSPREICSAVNCSSNNTPEDNNSGSGRCTVISTKRVTVSPFKQMTLCVENQCISTSSPVNTNLKRHTTRDRIKGRLDFDGSDLPIDLDKPVIDETSTSESEKEIDIFDIDLPTLDALGDFSFAEMLADLDFGSESIAYSCQPTISAPKDSISERSSPDSNNGNLGPDQVMTEFSSTVTEMLSKNEINSQGQDSLTAMKSVTRSIKIISPVKNQGDSRVGWRIQRESDRN